MQMDRKLRIAIDCRLEDIHQGHGTAVPTLAKALSESRAAGQEYTFIVLEGMQAWLAPYVYGPCSLATIPVSKVSLVKRVLRPIAPLRLLWRMVHTRAASVPVSDGYVESQHFDVVHFPTQLAYLTDIPSIYQPWDLQHLHYPHFFSQAEFDLRERYYRAFCSRASFVSVQAQWTKQDVIRNYKIAEEKIAVIPWASMFQADKPPSAAEQISVISKYGLPEQFFFYPARTWPHKNHEVILKALHLLKTNEKYTPKVIFTGASKEHRTTLEKRASELGVLGQVHFLGFLASNELRAIFSIATAMVFPSKFEGFGLPILEAFQAKLPVLSSSATTLPEIAKDGALYFNPDVPAELASLMKKILDVPELRQELIERGTSVLAHYSIDDLAMEFQTLYERAADPSWRDEQIRHQEHG